nr:DNA-directed DNA polymerase [Tanacetum cinerariifolium]
MIKPNWSLPFEIMCDASDYAIGAVIRQKSDKHFKPIHYASKTINKAQENYTTTEKELLAVVFAFDKFSDHLFRLENPDLGKLTKAEIKDLFPEERLMAISDKNNEPWYDDYANYLASRVLPFRSTRQEKQKFFSDLRHYFWDEPFLLKHRADRIIRRCMAGDEAAQILDNLTADHLEDIMTSPPPQEKSSRPGFTGHISFEMHVSWSKFVMHANGSETSPRGTKHLKSTSKSAKYLMFRELTLWDLSSHQTETSTS